MIQRQGWVVTDNKNRQKVCLVQFNLHQISQIRTQKHVSGHFDPFQIARKIRPIGVRLRNNFDLSEDVPENFETIFLLTKKE